MKKKRKRLQPDTLWAAGAAFLIVLQFWWLPGTPGSAQDSFSTSIDGKLGLFRTLSQLFSSVERERKTPVPATKCTLLIIGPDRLPTASEQNRLREFVQSGGTLLFAPSFDQPEVQFETLNIQLSSIPLFEPFGVPVEPPANVTTSPTAAPPTSPSTAPPATPPGTATTNTQTDTNPIGPREVICTSPLATGATEVAASSRIASIGWNHTDLVNSGGDTMAATWELGSGRIILCTTPEFFSNRSLLLPTASRLAVRLAAYGATNPTVLQSEYTDFDTSRIVISEYFNSTDSMAGVGVLFSPAMRIGTLQLILVIVLSIWLAFHRFGPAQQDLQHQRRSLTETAAAVGNLQYRIGDGGSLVAARLEYLRGQLRRRFGSVVTLQNLPSLARVSGLSLEEISTRLSLAEAQARQTRLPLSEATATIRWLGQLQQSLLGQIPGRPANDNRTG